MEKPAEKRCPECGNTFNLVAGFHAASARGSGRQSICKKCRSARDKQRNAGNQLARRQAKLRKKYGLELSEYEAILDSQQGVCAICGTDRCSTGRNLAVDHCHTSNRLRGVLCSDCNTGLGLAKDDTGILFKMLHYLLEWRMEHEVSTG